MPMETPPRKPPRTFAHDIYLKTKVTLHPSTCVKSHRNELRRRSRSFEHIYAEPESPLKEDNFVGRQIYKFNNNNNGSEAKDLFRAKETPSKLSRMRKIIEQSFSSVRRFGFMNKNGIINGSNGHIDDGSSEISLNEIRERIDYVKTLQRNHTLDQSDYYSSVADNKSDISLCKCCLIIQDNGAVTVIPRYVKLNNTGLIEELTNVKILDNDYFWFTIWTSDDKFMYAYCERQNRYKRRICIVSDVYFPELYIRIFKSIGRKEDIHAPTISFLKRRCCALPGDELNYGATLQVEVPFDCQISLNKQSHLLLLISSELLIYSIATLLHERRLVLVSKSEEKLVNSCRQLISLLYPLSWDYMFWPLVPSQHLILCSAINVPFLIGIRSSDIWKFVEKVKKRDDKLLIVDLDRGITLLEVGDEAKIIPKKIFKAVIMALDLCTSMNDPQDKYRDELTREAVMEMFVELLAHCRSFVTEECFHRDQLLAASKSKSHQLFLEWFTETRIFQNFVRFLQLRLTQSKLHPKYNQVTRMGQFEMKSIRVIQESSQKVTKTLLGKFKLAI
ncbi:DENN domain-containing protein 2A-like [Brevipalpus obovatus]|uniref:DENN domain-containing protein 2A-like n=1 Tax=Brevipalpus obovatus TaxID=246614 RepID=UPI003D9F0BB2